jgi:glyoxylase-like metal-dependent hydrolase (beta-lactamase superfamily II)
MASVDILLPGMDWSTNVGRSAFCMIALVESQGRRILVDTGHAGRRTELEQALGGRGLAPADIDVVFFTHAHFDHVQNFDLFPEATVLLHPREHQYIQRPHRNDYATPQWTAAAFSLAKIEEVVEGDEIAAGVRVLETPGHSAGTMSLLVDTDDGVAAIAGDGLHYAEVALTHEPFLVFWDEAAAVDSIRKIVAAGDLLYPGHDRPFRLEDGAIHYLAPFELTLTRLTPDMDGLRFATPERHTFVMPGIEDQRLP